MKRYRAQNGPDGPVVVCDDDKPGVVMAMTGRREDAEEIAAALNDHQGAVSLLQRVVTECEDKDESNPPMWRLDLVIDIEDWLRERGLPNHQPGQ